MKYNEILEEARACVGKGWWPIIDKFLPQIVELAPDCDIIVKEKYGALRMDVYGKTLNREKMDELELAALHESENTCEECGAPGTLHADRTWYQTLCNKCAKKE